MIFLNNLDKSPNELFIFINILILYLSFLLTMQFCDIIDYKFNINRNINFTIISIFVFKCLIIQLYLIFIISFKFIKIYFLALLLY